MSKRQLLMLLGILVISFLFLGLPFIFDRILAVIVGLIVVAVAYRLPPEPKSALSRMPYVEHRSAAPASSEKVEKAGSMSDIRSPYENQGSLSSRQ